MSPARPTLRYFGGKWRLAPWIIEHMPEHRIYVEPFGGAGSVLMRKPRSYAEVWNDLDDSVWALFKCLSNPSLSKDLKSAISATPYSRREFEIARISHPDPVEKSRRLIVRSFMGFGSDSITNPNSSTGFRSNSNRSGTTPAHDWINYPGQIDDFYERLKGVVIENKDAKAVMQDHDSPESLHYVDPPYHPEVRKSGAYKYEMVHGQHEELCTFLSGLKGKVVLSGYEHPIYESLGWVKKTKQSYADGAGKRTECLWIKP